MPNSWVFDRDAARAEVLSGIGFVVGRLVDCPGGGIGISLGSSLLRGTGISAFGSIADISFRGWEDAALPPVDPLLLCAVLWDPGLLGAGLAAVEPSPGAAFALEDRGEFGGCFETIPSAVM